MPKIEERFLHWVRQLRKKSDSELKSEISQISPSLMKSVLSSARTISRRRKIVGAIDKHAKVKAFLLFHGPASLQNGLQQQVSSLSILRNSENVFETIVALVKSNLLKLKTQNMETNGLRMILAEQLARLQELFPLQNKT
ncbi:hypothetical protein HK100_000983, partial [Physocladia obscura]